jgi:hypothetical protein
MESRAAGAGPRKLTVECDFIRNFMSKHAEYNDLLAPGRDKRTRTPQPTRPAASAARSSGSNGARRLFAGLLPLQRIARRGRRRRSMPSACGSRAMCASTKGASDIGTYNKTENSYRKFCKVCGGPCHDRASAHAADDVYANLLRGYTHQPTLHVN